MVSELSIRFTPINDHKLASWWTEGLVELSKVKKLAIKYFYLKDETFPISTKSEGRKAG